jgi:hypothetical protein
MLDELKGRSLADAEFVRLEAGHGDLRVLIRDWQEQSWWICFDDVLAFQGTGLGCGDLSHAREDPNDVFLLSSAAAAGENPQDYRCIAIIEVDDDRTVLKVAAKALHIE